MDILKLLKIGLMNLTLTVSCSHVFAQSQSNEPNPLFQEFNIKNSNAVRFTFLQMSNEIVKKYDQNKSNPLTVEFMDASNPSILKFYNSVTRRDNREHLAMSYFKNFNIDGVNRPTCFIFYEPEKNIFEGYFARGFTKEETFSYLVSHEMGHCLFMYGDIDSDSHGREVLADLFAIADLMNEGRYNLAVKVIKMSKQQNDKLHETGQYIEPFFLYANEKNLFKEKAKPQDVIDIAYNFFREKYKH